LIKKSDIASPPTITDVARLAGFGKMTVSRVINGEGYVRKDTEFRIRTAIEKLGYRPNEAARSLKGRRARTIGIIVPDLGDNFFATCANAAQLVAAKHGYMALVASSGRDETYEADEIQLMTQRNIAGLIIVPTREDWIPLRELASRGVPVVAFDRPLVGVSADEVTVDNIGGACLGVGHLIAHKHRRIACIGYDSNVLPIRDRIRGYERSMRDADLEVITHAEVESIDGIETLLRSWNGSRSRPTALFTLNNVTTINTLLAIQRLGLAVPDSYAIVGFDDLAFAPLLQCPITAIRQPIAEMGRNAAAMLFDRLIGHSKNEHSPIKLVLPVELVVRRSCGCSNTATGEVVLYGKEILSVRKARSRS